jgi:hypothetical protein
MAIKGGVPKVDQDAATREAYRRSREAEQFIAGAPGKRAMPWDDMRVRDDVMVQVNVKQPERLMLQLEWLVTQEGTTKRKLIEDILREGVNQRLKKLGIPT